jgi:hypothetical protein
MSAISVLSEAPAVVRTPAAGLSLGHAWANVTIREAIDNGLKDAVRARAKTRISTLRLIKAAITDRDIAARTNGVDAGVPDAMVLEILAKMIRQREESAKIYEEAGRAELAEQERAEIEVIRDFMPRQLSAGEMRAACEELVKEIGAAGLKDMGRCMGALKQRYAGKMDFSQASGHVKELLK